MPSKLWNLLLIGGFICGGFLVLSPYADQGHEAETSNEGLVTVIIEKQTTAAFRVPTSEGVTVQRVLEDFEAHFDVPVRIKESEYGPYVYALNDIPADGQDRWVYYVNDFAPTVGINNYNIHLGDIILFKYQSNQPGVTEEQQ